MPSGGNLGTLTAHIGLDTRGLSRGSRIAQGTFRRLSATASAAFGGIAKSALSVAPAIAALTAAFAGPLLLKKVIETGARFEQTMASVAGIMRATAAEMTALTNVARLMGETTEFSATQAGDALQFLGMAGFTATQAIQALPGVLDLATAAQLDLGRAADIASNALTAMQLPVSQLGRVNDTFVGTITRSNTNMEQMAEAFKFSAPVANAFGVSIEQLSARIGQLGNAGIQGSAAGTQLAMATQRANDIAVRFGFTSADLLDVLDDLGKRGATNADIMQLFGIRAGRAALILRNVTKETRAFEDTLALTGGEAKELAEKMRNTIGGAFKELKSVIESLNIDVFATFRDGLVRLVRATTEWFRSNKNEIIELANTIRIAFGGIAFVIGFLWQTIGAVVGGARDAYANLRDESSMAAAALRKHSDELTRAFAPPDLSLWNKFMKSGARVADMFNKLFLGVAHALANTFVGLLKFILNDLLLNILQAIWDVGLALERMAALDFAGAWTRAKGAWANITDILNDGAMTGDAMFEAWAKAGPKWEDFTWEFPAEQITREWLEGIDTIFDNIKKRFAPRQIGLIDFGFLKVPDIRDFQKIFNIRKPQIPQAPVLIDIPKIKPLKVKEELDAMTRFAERAARDMEYLFEDLFFNAMKFNWEGLLDVMARFWDNFLRSIATTAAEELGKIFTPFITNLFAPVPVPKPAGNVTSGPVIVPSDPAENFARGGIVTSPTMALIGEAGPEAVIPLDRFQTKRIGDMEGTNNQPIINNWNITTQDVASFKRSSSQIMSRATSAMLIARRNR